MKWKVAGKRTDYTVQHIRRFFCENLITEVSESDAERQPLLRKLTWFNQVTRRTDTKYRPGLLSFVYRRRD